MFTHRAHMCTLTCTGFSENYLHAQRVCPFSSIPPAWCVPSHLLRQVWLGTISQRHWMVESIWSLAARGPTHQVSWLFPYSVVMAALCTISSYKFVFFSFDMCSLRNHEVIWAVWRPGICFWSNFVLTQVTLLEIYFTCFTFSDLYVVESLRD